jgi:hypothetical protein
MHVHLGGVVRVTMVVILVAVLMARTVLLRRARLRFRRRGLLGLVTAARRDRKQPSQHDADYENGDPGRGEH